MSTTDFGGRRVVFPVVHVADLAQARRNVAIARDAGADGVFLVNHAITHQQLLDIFAAIRGEFPDYFIGLNCLDLSPADAFRVLPASANALWTDDARIREDQDAQPDAEAILAARKSDALYFGGVAFKYKRPVSDVASAARAASRYVDVVTTSGPGTGMAADPAKLRAMKEALGDAPLAVASGITPANVADYMPWVDCFLVATGISRSFEELDSGKVQHLVSIVHSYHAAPVPRSPFASESHEPRFVVEGRSLESMRAAIELWKLTAAELDFGGNISFVARRDSYLVIARNASHPPVGDPWERLPTPLPVERLAEWIMDWLRTATYPTRPWFDGGEAEGFTVFAAHYGCQELRGRTSYGQLVVIPKWFEIHK